MAVTDAWMSYQIDRAVVTFGIAIDNALQERVPIGDDGATVEKYTLEQLLDPEFLLPRPDVDTTPFEAIDGMNFSTV